MSYTNPTGEATYTYEGTTLSNVSIGLSTTETDNFYAQHLLVASGGKVQQNIRVSNGGILENAVIDWYGASVGSGGVASNILLSGRNGAGNSGTFYVYNGGVVNKFTTLDNAYVSTVLGATFTDVTVSGGYFTANGAIITNITLDNPLNYNSTTLNAFGGATVTGATVNAGNFNLTNATATGVTINGGALKVSAGGTATNVRTMLAGGSLLVSNGGRADGVTAVDGRVYVYNGGVLANAAISGATTANRAIMYLTEGAVADHVTLLDNAYASNYKATVNDLTISGGYFTANGVTVNGATLDRYRNVTAGTTLDAIGGAKVSGVTINYGYMYLRAGVWGSDTTLNGGTLIVAGEGATHSGATVRGGIFYASGGGIASDVTVSNGGTFSAYGDAGNTVAGQKIFVCSGGRAIAQTSNATMSDVTVYSGGLISAWSGIFNRAEIAGNAILWGGGRIYDAEVKVGGYIAVNNGAAVSGVTMDGGYVTVSNGGRVDDVTATSGTVNVADGGVLADATVSGGAESSRATVYMNGANAVANNITLFDYAYVSNYRGTVTDLAISGGYFTANGATVNGVTLDSYPNAGTGTTLNAIGGAKVSGAIVNAGKLTIDSDSVASDVNATGGTVNVKNGGTVNMIAENTLNNAMVVEGARVNYVRNRNSAAIQGADTNIAASTFHYEGAETANGFSVVNGVVKNLGADDVAYRLGVGTGITVENAVVKDSWRISAFGEAVVSGVAISGGPGEDTSIVMRENSIVYDAVLTGGAKQAIANIWDNATAVGTVVNSGGKLGICTTTAKIEDTILKAGGQIVFSAGAADTGEKLTLAFDDKPGDTMNVDLSKLAGSTTIYATGVETVGAYTLGSGGAVAGVTQKWGLYENAVGANGSFDDALNEVTYSFDGATLTTTALEIKTGAAAGLAGDNYTALRTNDRAAKWTGATADATLVTENFSGDAYLTVAGDAAAAIYGAGVNFNGTVNIDAKSGTIRNLAAGAEAGKTVGAVKLTFEGATLDGAGYAGGFGTVANAAETLVVDGAFTKDFYAGALANYAKEPHATQVGSVSITIEDGTFSGNIYGASAVKAGAATTTVHSVGDVTVDVKGGATTKGAQACLFAGGYATGSVLSETAVYTVDSVTATISGGSWGEAAGGRGIFGGAFASGVKADAGDVTLTISGGTFGNVYGGGWAQKGGKSVVGDVDLTISGGTMTNVYGGGTHSKSAGSENSTTAAGNVTITVSGGTITDDIYASGQLAGDTTGTAKVIFTGTTDFGCGVWGYSYAGGDNAATLTFDAYTGTFSGAIGGFDSITVGANVRMTLTTAAEYVSNTAWKFDLTERADSLSEASLLTWDNADFTNDSINVSFADDDQVRNEFDLAAVASAEAFSGTTFDVEVNGAVIANDLAYEAQIADGDYEGWGFTLDKGVLKFKELA